MPTNTLPQHDVWATLEAGLRLKPGIPRVTRRRSKAAKPLAPTGSTLLAPKGDGERTAHLTSLYGRLLASGMSTEEATATCLAWNSTNTPPLPEDKVVSTCASIAQSDARNHPERAQRTAEMIEASGPLTPLFDIAEAEVGKFLATTPPPRRWVLDDFLPLGITATIISPGGVGKSQFLMQLAYSVATGLSLCGRWPVGEEGSVLMLCAEDAEEEIHRRVNRIHRQLGQALGPAISNKLVSRLFVRSVIGEDMLLTRATGHRSELSRTRIADRLAMTAQQLSDVKLIILDPGSRFRGGDENSNDDGTRFVQALEHIGKLTGATILVAHHSGKGALNTKTGPSQNDSRGASALTDGVRWQLVLTTVTPQHKDFKPLQAIAAGHYVEAALVKSNYTAPQASVHLRREPDGYLQAVQATPTSPIANPALMQLLQVISKSSCPLTAKQIETSFCGRGKAIKVGQKRSRELMKEARDAGLTQGHGLIPVTLTREGQAILASAGAATIPDSAAAAAKAVAAAGRQTAALPLATGKC